MYITQSLKRNAQLYPKKVATSFNERTFTWEESLERISKLAYGIKKLGVNVEDRVAILAHNSDRYFEFIYSVSWLGGVFVPINTANTDYQYILEWAAIDGNNIEEAD